MRKLLMFLICIYFIILRVATILLLFSTSHVVVSAHNTTIIRLDLTAVEAPIPRGASSPFWFMHISNAVSEVLNSRGARKSTSLVHHSMVTTSSRYSYRVYIDLYTRCRVYYIGTSAGRVIIVYDYIPTVNCTILRNQRIKYKTDRRFHSLWRRFEFYT